MIFLFPGQGVQGAGMSEGADPHVLHEAYDVLGFDPSAHDLHSTRWAQPAIVACSLARASALRRAGVEPSAVAGHSLGEYSALVVAGSLRMDDGLRLVQARAEAMDEAARETLFGGLAASGWHTAAITMRLLVGDGAPFAGGIVGAGAEVSWPGPTRPLDVLRVVSEVVDITPSRSKPRGIVTLRSETLNQHGDVRQLMISKLVVPRRQPQAADARECVAAFSPAAC